MHADNHVRTVATYIANHVFLVMLAWLPQTYVNHISIHLNVLQFAWSS